MVKKKPNIFDYEVIIRIKTSSRAVVVVKIYEWGLNCAIQQENAVNWTFSVWMTPLFFVLVFFLSFVQVFLLLYNNNRIKK